MNQFPGDDAEMNAAIEEAQRRLPEFYRALDEDARKLIPAIEGALVKARFESPITHRAEHMWVQDVGIEDGKFVGTLSNEPSQISELSKGEWIAIDPETISD